MGGQNLSSVRAGLVSIICTTNNNIGNIVAYIKLSSAFVQADTSSPVLGY